MAEPYDFHFTVLHAIVALVSDNSASLLTEGRSACGLPLAGTLTLLVHNPDGKPLSDVIGGTLRGYWSQEWHKLALAPASEGRIILKYRLPRSVSGRRFDLG